MKKHPNILIVMTDHQRGDTVLPGHPAIAPNLRRLASQGVTFSNAYCPTAHCCPSRATFFTGLYPSLHGVWNNVCNELAFSRGLKPGVKLWSEDLAKAGYSLHFAGKWHVSSTESPSARGWKEYDVSGAGFIDTAAQWENYRKNRGKAAGAAREDGEIIRPGYPPYKLYRTIDGEKGNPHDVTVVERTLEIIDKVAEDRKPWCIFAGFIGPHDPYAVPKKYVDMYKPDKIQLPPNFSDDMRDKPGVYRRMRKLFGQLSEGETRNAVRHFLAYCTYLDDLFGDIVSRLDEKGLGEDTLVLFTSDHGDYCGEHGLFCKGVPAFRAAYHVPALVRWPSGIKTSRKQFGEFVSLADFAPTFLELAGIRTERHFTGRSLVPFLENGAPPDWRDEMHTQLNGVELYFTQRSVMTDRFRYVFNGFDMDELYDLRNDPGEVRNLAADDGCDDVKRDMCRRMWRFARREMDASINPYITVGLAPYGPGEGI